MNNVRRHGATVDRQKSERQRAHHFAPHTTVHSRNIGRRWRRSSSTSVTG